MTIGRALAAYRRWWAASAPARTTQVAFRVAFFAILGLDGFLAIGHAARYGSGGFNVSHAPALDGFLPVPERTWMMALHALQAVLAIRLALGAAGRASLVLLTALFGATYFWSQLDSYQHHYLVFWLLVALAARPGRLGDDGPGWPFRLVLCQISAVYLWAAMAKLDPAWLDGRVLGLQVTDEWVRGLIERYGGLAAAAKSVVALELGLAVAIHLRRLRPIVAPLGIAFHVGVELAGFRIGLFSYFMIALYLLVLPEPWLAAAARGLGRLSGPLDATRKHVARAFAPGDRLGRGAIAAALVVATAALAALPFREVAWVVAGGALALAGASLWRDRTRAAKIAAGHLIAAVALLAVARTADTAIDHYRFLGGASRRLGDLEQATSAYRRVIELDPDDPRGWLGLARTYDRAGRGPESRAAAKRALALQPTSEDARKLVDRWSSPP